jgi:hypothetical protein
MLKIKNQNIANMFSWKGLSIMNLVLENSLSTNYKIWEFTAAVTSRKKTNLWLDKWICNDDNEPSHAALSEMRFLAKKKLLVLKH